MTDLLRVLPHFPVGQYAHLISTLEKIGLTTSDLLTLEAADLGKRTQLPLLDIKRLCAAILAALHDDLGVFATSRRQQGHQTVGSSSTVPAAPLPTLKNTPASLASQWQTISTLDPDLDRALGGGGIPAGYVTEITGESGAGKTQFLLTLLLAVQLPPPHGLGRPALYISTEAPLSTRRLAQMLTTNPFFKGLDETDGASSVRPSLDNIISTVTPDLESQDHILTYQVPVEIERRNIGLLVLDSVAANYRAEFERSSKKDATTSSSTPGPGARSSNMGARTAELVRLGMQLRDLAQKYNLAVVVSNQVADRFGSKMPEPITSSIPRSSSSGIPRSSAAIPMATATPGASTPYPYPHTPYPEDDPPQQHHPSLHLDNQQRFFTGWGDDPYASFPLKTPSLGLVWSTQISARIALFKRPAYGRSKYQADDEDAGGGGAEKGMPMLKSWRRWMKVVFAGWTPESGTGIGEGSVEFEVWIGGLRGVDRDKKKNKGQKVKEGEDGEGKGKEKEG